MPRTITTSRRPPAWGVLTRGAGTGALAGLAVGGLVGTVEWPVVDTFFGAALGVFVGLVSGFLTGLVLAAMTRRHPSPWQVRAGAGLVFALVTVVVCVLVTTPPVAARDVVGDALIALAALVVGAWAGPAIAWGHPRVHVPWDIAPVPMTRLFGRAVVLGSVVGAVGGGVAGLVLGLGHPPTAGFALVEGAILGAVSGIVLAVTVAGLLALAGLRRRP